jgi:hypothetical protein
MTSRSHSKRGVRMKYAKALLIGALFAANILAGEASHGQTRTCSDSSLPSEVHNLLLSRFSGFQVVVPKDLDSDEIQEWKARKQDRCPGYVHAQFGPSVAGYAIVLMRKTSPTETHQMLVFLRQEAHGYAVRVLSPSSKVEAHTLVVSLGASGEYHPVEGGRSIRTHWPVILYEAIGAGIEGYYFSNGSWHSILLSE